MDLFLYIVASAVYIMVMHFAVGIKTEFNVWFMTGFFVLGGAIGMWLHSYETGFIGAVILTLLFY